MGDRRWSDADQELVRSHLVVAPVDDCGKPSCEYCEDDRNARADAVLAALTAAGWRDTHDLEKPNSILCDCDPDRDDHRPTNPETDAWMDHHCDCTAVETVAQLLGETATTHHRQCAHTTTPEEPA